jgi:mono/diheme cytochrome c family protein
MKTANILLSALALPAFLLGSCTTNPDSPGLEFMPDMYRSHAVEAYVDYGMDPYHFTEETAAAQRNTSSARKPVEGTIAYRGEDVLERALSMPYPFENTPEGYEEAGLDWHSPLKDQTAAAEAGEALYTTMCTQCHGEKGKGDGKISQNGHIVGIPDYSVKLVDLPDGKMYHTIKYGKGLMGSHASQLNPRQRWEIIAYINVLQGGDDVAEDNDENTQ